MSDPAEAIEQATFVADELVVTRTDDGLLFHFSYGPIDAPAILYRPASPHDLEQLRRTLAP